ncbi:MAG: MerR family transcriptional regulator [Luminiphilus sp.]|nr:MerR family transcriptional regulator [Luminiphilus sp.]
MNAPIKSARDLEPRPLYGIGTVARLTGLKSDTLRVWERRYGLGASYKSPTGRRQYTQSDLDHLQLVAALVAQGVRIGEIAASDRKTLEILLEKEFAFQTGKAKPIPPAKSRVVFLGPDLCHWLDAHQGCISGVSALLARMSVEQAVQELYADDTADLLVAHCPSLTLQHIRGVEALAERLSVRRTIVLYQFANQQWLSELERMGHTALQYPVEPSRLAFEIGRTQIERETEEGMGNLSELMPAKPRMFSDAELRAASREKIVIDCECPRHLSDLIRSLNEFESYSSACSVDNWKDAAIHASIYAYTCQARHLMEKALQSAMEGRTLNVGASD